MYKPMSTSGTSSTWYDLLHRKINDFVDDDYNMCYTFAEVKNMEFSQLVRFTRQKLGMSQEHLARALHVSFATVNRWENGKTRPNQLTETVFYDFCKQHGIEPENLNDTEE
ncbi:helix-turn-helix domain-containing protein [Oscillospiraceae bacterium 52-8]|uniref:helix-turn-helix domain-containing protein n=1 Tax=Bittarella massiliensis (ex Durand et al. 2017) TaxID=1720313 RepID=UPI001FAE5749|nr:helix-turn-helix domain-containing protein [Bittarella massiliensis (ex Durand et al. 2017)]